MSDDIYVNAELPKPGTPLWMKYPKCSCCGKYIIVKPKMVNVRRGRHIRIIEVVWNALILGNKEAMKEADVTSKDLCIKCLYNKENKRLIFKTRNKQSS